MIPVSPPPQVQPPPPGPGDPALRRAAEALEATFLAEMLKSAGLGEARDSFGGGAGESQFASMLAAEQARALAATGGIGLAEQIFNSLKEHDHAEL
ncbi:MAG: rod-binding protein [Pseudooceanicola sp.]